MTTGGFASQAEPEDVYKLALSNSIANRIGQNFVGCWDMHFVTVKGMRLCRIVVRHGRALAYLDGDLYARGPVGKYKLPAQAATAYVQERFI